MLSVELSVHPPLDASLYINNNTLHNKMVIVEWSSDVRTRSTEMSILGRCRSETGRTSGGNVLVVSGLPVRHLLGVLFIFSFRRKRYG